MIIERQILEEVLLLKPQIFEDDRGYFFESFKQNFFKDFGLDIKFVQDNEVYSCHAGILRGLHYQLENPQGKLVHVVSGAIRDVIVDIRTNSPDFGKSVVINLDSKLHNMIFVPEGFAHGFISLKNLTEVQYKTNAYWDKDYERSLSWQDTDLKINWPLANSNERCKIIINDKDSIAPTFKEIKKAGDVF